MKMPTTTNNKVEAKPSTDVGDATKQCLNCLEKKVRNLEKRKGRIEQNQEKANKGTKLEKEQENSLQQYDQVTHDLEFARELHKQFLQIHQEHEKMAKKQAKREKAERQAVEIKRISEILQLQTLLDLMGGDKVREDFKTGKHGAVVLTEDNLNQLDELYQAISPSRDDGNEYAQQLTTAAEHLVNFLDGKDRQVVGTTYKELKELITLINGCGYFEKARQAETEDASAESKPETEETTDTTEEVATDAEFSASSGQDQLNDQQQQQPIDLTVGTTDGAQSQRELQSQPLNTLEQDVFFAASSTAYQNEEESQFSQASHPAASRMPDFQSFTNNRPFQFIQTSYVMPEPAAPGVVDPAVIVAQPAGSTGLQFMSQGFEPAASSQAPAQTQQQPAPSQQPSQPPAQQQSQSVSSVAVSELSQPSAGLQPMPQQPGNQQAQQPQQAAQDFKTQDFNSQSFAQAGLQQNIQTDSLFSGQSVAVTEVSGTLSTHSGVMGQMRDENVSSSPYEIPPSIPMPPSQSQDQNQLDQQQQQQEKKFQMNASAPVFQSMYAQAPGQGVPVTVPPPSVPTVADTQAPPPSTDFANTPTPGGDYGQSNPDFQQSYQSNNGFPSGAYPRGGRGFRGGRGGGGGNGVNRNGGPGGSPMQNGFGGRGGSANTNNSRGGRGGTYQGYPPSNNYRPDSFQGGYNAGGFGGGFQKRGGMNNTGGPGYPRGGGVGGNSGRGGSGGMRGGMSRGGGGAGPRGAPRAGFSRPMPTQ